MTLGSNGAIRESVQVGLGITLISPGRGGPRADVGRLEEWPCADLPRHCAWHVVACADEHAPGPAELFLAHLAGDGFTLVRKPSPG